MNRKTILVVEDDADVRLGYNILLTAHQYTTHFGADSISALSEARKHRPDLVLLDLGLPAGDGFVVLDRLRSNVQLAMIPVIVVSARDAHSNRDRAMKAGARAYVQKPWNDDELLELISRTLGESDATVPPPVTGAASGAYPAPPMLARNAGRAPSGASGGVAQVELAESESLYRSTFDSAPVGIVHVAPSGEWLNVNIYLTDLLGYSRAELQRPGVQALLQTETASDDAEAFQRLAAGVIRQHVNEAKRFRRSDGGLVWTRITTSAQQDHNGKVKHFISVIEDITERRTTHDQLSQKSTMAAIGRLASGVAHDFNNLLTVIMGSAEFIRGNPDQPMRDDLTAVINAAQRGEYLTNQLLAFSGQQDLHAVPLDLNELLSTMSPAFRDVLGDKIELVMALGHPIQPALADRAQLEQAILNLVINARDAMPSGGSLTLETMDVDLENSSFHAEPINAGPYVMLAVSDTGAGMSQEHKRHLFEPFSTPKQVGQGLGMSATYGIIKQSNGILWVYSEFSKGTTFKVYLPRATRISPAEVVPQLPPATKRPSETVLLIEDDAGVLRLASRILVEAGYRVLSATNSDDAELLVARHAAEIDLMVTDVIMPGCSGPALFRRLQVPAPKLRVLYMSGYTQEFTARNVGIDRDSPFVQKPFTAARFRAHVVDALSR